MKTARDIINLLIEKVGDQAVLDHLPIPLVKKAAGNLYPIARVAKLNGIDVPTLWGWIQKGYVIPPDVRIINRRFYTPHQLLMLTEQLSHREDRVAKWVGPEELKKV